MTDDDLRAALARAGDTLTTDDERRAFARWALRVYAATLLLELLADGRAEVRAGPAGGWRWRRR